MKNTDESLTTANAPKAISSVYEMKEDNDQIFLYSGPMEIMTRHGVSSGTGKLRYLWQPKSRILVDATLDFQKSLTPQDELMAQFRLPEETDFVDIEVAIANTETYPHAYGYLIGSSGGCTSGTVNELQSMIFHVPNFLSFAGSLVRYDNGDESVWAESRATVQLGNWQIIIDAVTGYNLYRQGYLERTSGNALTHVGEIRTRDGSPFSVADGKLLLERLHQWLSFCRGNWTGPILANGLGRGGEVIWRDWRSHAVQPSLKVPTWVDRYNYEFLEPGFAGFAQRCDTPLWKDAIPLAITWYVECNRQASGVEASIILSQTGLELLGWVYLVEELKVLSVKGYNDLEGADKIRLILLRCGIPFDVPDRLSRVQEFSRQNNRIDGPDCLVRVRNKLVHGQDKHRQFLKNVTAALRSEIATLSVWYLEMVMLNLFGYKGNYNCRLGPCSGVNQAVQPVPWKISNYIAAESKPI